jgi:hypothetical protein
LQLYARGERGADFPAPFSFEYEAAIHDTLESEGVPVPHVYALIDGAPRTLLMTRAPGVQGLAFAANDDARRALLEQYADLLSRVHHIDPQRFAARGLTMPSGSDIVISEVFRRAEASYLTVPRPDPAVEFLRRWVRRNAPPHREVRFTTYDANQFLHHEGRITALIDFELAHLGDPYMDLAALRLRDTMEPAGDLRPFFTRYEHASGQRIDYDRLRYFEVSYAAVTPMLQWPVLNAPDINTDYISHLTWHIDNVRYGLDVMAELLGIELSPIGLPQVRQSPAATAHQHLVASLRTPVATDYGGFRRRADYRLARHLARVDEVGAGFEADDVADVAALLQRPLRSIDEADAALMDFLTTAGPGETAALVQLFDRRFQRRHLLLGPPTSAVVRHPPLQALPDRPGLS